MSYIDYIHANAIRIGNERQEAFTVENVYGNKVNNLREIRNDLFQQRVDALLGVPMTRQFVIDSFHQNLYFGYVTAMLWGGLGLTNWSHLMSAMTIAPDEVENKLRNIKALLRANQIQQAFMSLQISRDRVFPQNNKLVGVDISYFTKLLYFLYDGNSAVPPIIFDKWGTYFHAGLLISKNEIDQLISFYKMGYNEKGKFNISIKSNRSTSYRYNVYADYMSKMAVLSSELNLSSPDLLEEFLFGKELKPQENRNNANPRFFVRNYVTTFYNNEMR